jgi:putative transposase
VRTAFSSTTFSLASRNHDAFIERFNQTLRNEVLDLYLFRSLDEVREVVSQWRRQYNEDRPHDALGGLPPFAYAKRNLENSTSELSI